jgi:cytohesin
LVAQLIAAGAKVDVQQGPDHAPCAPFGNGEGPPPNTPLHLAAEAGSLESAKALITAHASMNARGDLEETPLHFAVKGEPTAARIELVRLLLAHGAQVNAKNKNDETPLDLVKDQDNPIRKLLLDHGAKPGEPTAKE